jgi:uncharacterized protein (TIGR04562 family)
MTLDIGELLEIPWEIMDTMMAGTSAIDVSRLYLTGIADAEDFLRCYGFDLQRAEEAREVEALRAEALQFILQELLCDEPDLEFPAEIAEERDVRRILLWASMPHVQPRQKWACSLLRVMHTFAHAGSHFQDLYGEQLRDQILQRFEAHLHEEDGHLFLGRDAQRIPLKAFQMRGRKSRRSIALKLLQKAENVSADVFDWVGIRLVTEHRFDALLVARYLRVHNVIMFANVRPGRSRNTLLDLEQVRDALQRTRAEVEAGCLTEAGRWQALRAWAATLDYPAEAARSTYNPFSASSYHAIQFTCSQQIRVPNPHLAPLRRWAQMSPRTELMARTLERWGIQTGTSFFFPFELQILDHESFERSRNGRASHADYKARQRHAVKRRLWPDWIGHDPLPLPDARAVDVHAETHMVIRTAPGYALP